LNMIKHTFIMVLLIQSLAFSDEYCEAFQAFEGNRLEEAKEKLDPLAFKGDAKAQNLLGLVNLELQNNSAAQRWLQSAATKGDARAAYNLGVYFYILGNTSQAIKWMHKAEPLTQAKLALGFLYTMSDLKKAKEYLSLASKEGDTFANSHLCALLVNNQTREDNKYVPMCQGNVVHDLYVTGKLYTSPKKFGSVEKAIFYLKPAADKGHVKAMNLLGEIYYKRRASSDEARALEYFNKAAAQGNVDAKVNAAWIYYTGVKWTRKPQQGFEMLSRAVARGNAKAKYYMGLLYIRAQTVGPDSIRRDPVKGLGYIKAAAAQNSPDAIQYLIKNTAAGDERNRYQAQLKKYYKEKEKESALNFLHEGC